MAFVQSCAILFSVLATTEAAPITTPAWLRPMIPVKDTTLSGEIKCYSLPYGGIGFLSHFLTYWAILWLGYGKRPYMPWKNLSAGWTDLMLSTLQIICSVAIAAFTINRCRNRWQFMLIAIWKVVMSIGVGIWGLRASYLTLPHPDSIKKTNGVMWSFRDWSVYTLVFYSMGMVVGMTGLVSLVWQMRTNQQILQISFVFGSITGAIVALCLFMPICLPGLFSTEQLKKLWMAIVFSVLMVCAFYSDWILGAIAGSLVGAPSGDNSYLYWAYFAAKRLPLLMT